MSLNNLHNVNVKRLHNILTHTNKENTTAKKRPKYFSHLNKTAKHYIQGNAIKKLFHEGKKNLALALLQDHLLFSTNDLEALFANDKNATQPQSITSITTSAIIRKTHNLMKFKAFFDHILQIKELGTKITKRQHTSENLSIQNDFDVTILTELHNMIEYLKNSSSHNSTLYYIKMLLDILPTHIRLSISLSKLIDAINTYEKNIAINTLDAQYRIIEQITHYADASDAGALLCSSQSFSPSTFIDLILHFGIDPSSLLIQNSATLIKQLNTSLQAVFNQCSDHEGNSLLHIFCKQGNEFFIRQILELHQQKKIRIDISLKDSKYRSTAKYLKIYQQSNNTSLR